MKISRSIKPEMRPGMKLTSMEKMRLFLPRKREHLLFRKPLLKPMENTPMVCLAMVREQRLLFRIPSLKQAVTVPAVL